MDQTASPLVGTIAEQVAALDLSGDGARSKVQAHRPHREAFWAFVLGQAEPWHHRHLTRLLQLWENANTKWYDGELIPPIILLAEPSAPVIYGQCSPISGYGARSEIRIRPSLLRGTHPHIEQRGEGADRFVDDVLLHEQIHQWQQEILVEHEHSYHGHGPIFRDKANQISADLGLGPVRTMKRRGPDRELPSCAQWPHCVRPPDHYLGAYVPTIGDKEEVNLADLAADQMLKLASTLAELGPDWESRPEQEVRTLEEAQKKLAEAFEDIGLWVYSFHTDKDEDSLARPVDLNDPSWAGRKLIEEWLAAKAASGDMDLDEDD